MSVRTTVCFLSSNPHIHWLRENAVNPVAVTWFCHLMYSSPHLGGGGERARETSHWLERLFSKTRAHSATWHKYCCVLPDECCQKDARIVVWCGFLLVCCFFKFLIMVLLRWHSKRKITGEWKRFIYSLFGWSDSPRSAADSAFPVTALKVSMTAIVKSFICHRTVLSKSVFVLPWSAKTSCIYEPIKGWITGIIP